MTIYADRILQPFDGSRCVELCGDIDRIVILDLIIGTEVVGEADFQISGMARTGSRC